MSVAAEPLGSPGVALGVQQSRRRGRHRWLRCACVVVLGTAGVACAARAPGRPAAGAVPDATAVTAFDEATAACTGLRTLTASLRLSGRAGERVRGTLHAGLAAPASVRFEALAPIGQPFFILAGRDNRATLWLPRDRRVLVDAPLPDVLERLLGVHIDAVRLRTLLAGCPPRDLAASDGRSWTGGWRSVQLGAETVAYLRAPSGRPLVVAIDDPAWHVDYANHQNGWPRTVRIRRRSDDQVDLTAVIDDLSINTAIDEVAFTLTPPRDAAPLTLDELVRVAPLRPSSN